MTIKIKVTIFDQFAVSYYSESGVVTAVYVVLLPLGLLPKIILPPFLGILRNCFIFSVGNSNCFSNFLILFWSIKRVGFYLSFCSRFFLSFKRGWWIFEYAWNCWLWRNCACWRLKRLISCVDFPFSTFVCVSGSVAAYVNEVERKRNKIK